MQNFFADFHYYGLDRKTPITLEEFIEYGFTYKDYELYIAYMYKLQGDFIIDPYHAINGGSKEIIDFCCSKGMLSDDAFDYADYIFAVKASDASYRYKDLCYPMDPDEFRLRIERKLSKQWEDADLYFFDHYDISRRGYVDNDVIYYSKYDPTIKESVDIEYNEAKRIQTEIQHDKDTAEKELILLEKELDNYIANPPPNSQTADVSFNIDRLKKLYALYDRCSMLENAYDIANDIIQTCTIDTLSEKDTLYVYCNSDTCKKDSHSVSDSVVKFEFYLKPDKRYKVKYCNHCSRYYLTLDELTEIHDKYGVPKVKVVYDDDGIISSDFAETSIFYDMGYTVSESAGLTASQRQNILKRAIDSRKATKYQVLNFLRQRIAINGAKSGNEGALKKWREDCNYIQNL